MTTRHTDDHPTRNEDEYFARQNAELVKQMRAKLDAERLSQERKAYYMKCPKCGADLVEQPVGHVKLDTCPSCHGVWLDQGEIDLIQQMRHMGGNHAPQSPLGRIMNDILDMFHRPK